MTKSNSSVPTWYRGVSRPPFPKLAQNGEADVVIIGGGLTGVLSAYLLAKEGKHIVLIEKGAIGDGATGHTTGFLTQYIDTDAADLMWMVGNEKAKLIIKSHGAAIDLVERIAKDERIDCDFMRCDNVVFAEAGKNGDARALTDELEAIRTLGLDASIHEGEALPFPNAGSLRIKNQAKFHPLKFLAGVAIAAQKAGAIIYEHSEATHLEQGDKGVTVQVGGNEIKAAWAFSASYEPFAEPWGLYFKKSLYMDYVMELEVLKGFLPEATLEDTENPYHYFRIDRRGTNDRIIIGGESHRKDIPVPADKNFAALEAYVGKTFPRLSYKIVTRWRGATLEPIDGIAFIGPYKSEHEWYAFGFSGNGMTYAGIAAIMFRDAVMGKENLWHEIYDVGRIPSAKSLWIKGRDYTGEFVHGALKNTFTS